MEGIFDTRWKVWIHVQFLLLVAQIPFCLSENVSLSASCL
jgi:hypothetical protein